MSLALAELPAMERTELLTVNIDQLKKSPGNKRVYNERRARVALQPYDDYLAGIIHGAARGEWIRVIDGWTRVGAARIAGRTEVRVLVIYGYTEEDDARAFDVLNTKRVRISAADEFWARVDYREPIAVSVLDVCATARVDILKPGPSGATSGSNALRPRSTRAYAALQASVSRHGPAVLGVTLATIEQAWPDDERGLEALPIQWISGFVALYQGHPAWSLPHFTKSLSSIAAVTLSQRVKLVEGATGHTTKAAGASKSLHPAARTVLVSLYNHGLSSRRRLPEASQSELKRASLGQNPWIGER